MAIAPEKFREIVFQLLYSHDIAKGVEQNMVELLSQQLTVSKKCVRDAQLRLDDILKHLSEIDTLIAKTSFAYEFERIQSVERNILRIGVYELLHDKSIPPKVAIAESLRLTKKFSTKEAAAFVNAIMDAIFKSSQGKAVDAIEIKKAAETLNQTEKS